MNDCRREVAASVISGDEHVFAEDVGELCKIENDVQFLGFVPGWEQLSEAVVVKEEDSYSLEEEEIIECDPIGVVECDPIGVVECDHIGVDTPSVVIKSEEDSAPKTPEDAIHTTQGPDKIPRKKPPKEVQHRKISNCSKEQLKGLERTFKQTYYPDYDLEKKLAARLGLTYTTVRIWFRNRRKTIADNIRKRGSKKPNLGSSNRAESTLLLNPGTESEEYLAKGREKKPREIRHRTKLSSEQLIVLERTFERHPNPDPVIIEDLSVKLGIDNYQLVKTWFRNRKPKARKSDCSKSQLPKKTAVAGKQCSMKETESGASKKITWKHLSDEQLERLEWAFEHNPTPDENIVEYLAEGLSLTTKIVLNWFRHQRQKVRMKIPETRTQILRESHDSESQLPTRTARAEDRDSILPQAGGSSSSPRDEVQSSTTLQRNKQKPIDEPSKEPVNSGPTSKNSPRLGSCTKTYPGQSGPSRQAERCQVCYRVPKERKVRNSICYPCDSFMKRCRNQTRGRLVVPRCSHKGTQVLAGCRGCRLYRCRQVAMKQRAVSQPKMTQNQPAVQNCKTSSELENTPTVSMNNDRRRRSGRILARAVTSGEGFSEFQSGITSVEYSMDLQKKIHVTGKLNKLRSIASTLSNPERMETKDRLVLSDELDGCVDDLLSLVLGIEPPPASKTKENLSPTKEPLCPAEPLVPNTPNETSFPSLVRQIQSLEKVVKESIKRWEGQMQNSVRKETSTQTDAYLLFSFVSQPDNFDEPPSLSDGQPHYRNYSDSIPNVQPSGTPQNSPISATRCQVCDQARPLGDVDHNFICTRCQWLMETLKLSSRPNRNLLVPRCAHRGTHASFGCKDCLVFRYNRVMSVLMPNLTQVELTSSQAKGSYGNNNGFHVPAPMNTPRMTPESHQSTSGHYTQHLMPSYPPRLHTSPIYPQAGNVQPAMSDTTQLSWTLSQGGTTAETIPYQRISANEKKVPVSPLGQITKMCPSVYGRNYNGMIKWCEGCRRRNVCTRFL